MTLQKLALLAGACALAFSACVKSDGGSSSGSVTTQKDKVSYAIGLDIGRSLKQQSLDLEVLDLDKLKIGMRDAMGTGKSILSDSQISEAMSAFQKDMMAHQDSIRKVKGEANEKAGKEFLAKNGKEPGVTTLPSGLQYQVLNEGKGPKPKATEMVTVHYAGTLLDGTEFDSSIKRGRPATFPVTGVIPGWTEALQLMSTGSKWKLFVPSTLAYGANGAGAQIGPNAALIFEVELLSIGDASAAKPGLPGGHP